MNTIRVLIVDDEPLARDVIRHCLTGKPGTTIVGECANGKEAVESIRRCKPDIMFLDVQMPGMDGFGVLKTCPPNPLPVLVFVTAYDHYALRAFEAHALDYLLKPFDQERFDRAFEHAVAQLARIRAGQLCTQLQALLQTLRQPSVMAEEKEPEPAPTPSTLAVRDNGRITLVHPEEVEWIDADGDYVHLHTAARQFLLHETMNSLECRLDSRLFVRIHRSTIVNLRAIKELQPHFNGEYFVTLKNGVRLKLSRHYKDRAKAFLP